MYHCQRFVLPAAAHQSRQLVPDACLTVHAGVWATVRRRGVPRRAWQEGPPHPDDRVCAGASPGAALPVGTTAERSGPVVRDVPACGGAGVPHRLAIVHPPAALSRHSACRVNRRRSLRALCAYISLNYRLPRFHALRGAVSLCVASFVALVAIALGTLTAQAHAAYKSSNPAANSVLKSAPTTVSITFVQKLDPQGLSITVYGNKAEVVSTGKAQISPTDPYTATVSMKGDDSDIYRVDWNNVSAEDGDPTLGAFVFAVDPSGTSDKVSSPASTIASSSSSSGVSPLVAILFGMGGLVVGAAGSYMVMRPRDGR
jgi:methionine-rich copper-binding protein CopC